MFLLIIVLVYILHFDRDISIHPMFLLIIFCKRILIPIFKISIHPMFLLIKNWKPCTNTQMHFNTSHVSINPKQICPFTISIIPKTPVKVTISTIFYQADDIKIIPGSKFSIHPVLSSLCHNFQIMPPGNI